MSQRIAVIGTGISGLGAAWALHNDHDVTVYEARDRLGGHSNTVDVATASGMVPVDTGFIVYNEVTYPHLTRLFAALDVPTQESDMSFSFAVRGEFEYSSSVRGLTAQKSNLLRRRYRSMVRDILRFRREGTELIQRSDNQSISGLLSAEGFSEGFLEDYLLPMSGAIWSARRHEIRDFPARSMLEFLANHGLIDIVGRPQWRTVSGGSREYVRRLAAPLDDRIRLGARVTRIERQHDGVGVRGIGIVSDGVEETYDQVVLATHSDQALQLLGEAATDEERLALKAIPYSWNRAVLHSDPDLMPQRRAVWASWNSSAAPEGRETQQPSVTYWMNRLQSLPTSTPLFVSLNPHREPRPDLVHQSFDYAHPQFDHESVAAQHRLAGIQGLNRTWFAGAYLGYGFHEDGLQSGLHVAAALGSRVPWYDEVVAKSSAPAPTSLVT